MLGVPGSCWGSLTCRRHRDELPARGTPRCRQRGPPVGSSPLTPSSLSRQMMSPRRPRPSRTASSPCARPTSAPSSTSAPRRSWGGKEGSGLRGGPRMPGSTPALSSKRVPGEPPAPSSERCPCLRGAAAVGAGVPRWPWCHRRLPCSTEASLEKSTRAPRSRRGSSWLPKSSRSRAPRTRSDQSRANLQGAKPGGSSLPSPPFPRGCDPARPRAGGSVGADTNPPVGLLPQEMVLLEIDVMNQLNHRNLIQLYDAIETPREIILFMEL